MLRLRDRVIFTAVFVFILKASNGDDAPDVIIIGAGAAGIAAATKLLENNITDITILEAEGRIGGRIHSVKFGDGVVDLGAQWCHGEKGNIVYELVKDLDILRPGQFEFNYCYSSQDNFDRSFAKELEDLSYSLYYEIKTEYDDMSLGAYLTKRFNETIIAEYGDNPGKIKFALEFLNLFMHNVLALEGAFSWYDVAANNDYSECEGNHALSWNGHGYKTILDILMKKYPNPEKQLPIDDKILLNKEVTKIVWDGHVENLGRVSVECLDGSVYSADHVIFTPSLGVLKAQYKTIFHPPLPNRKIEAVQNLGIAAVAKVFLHFPTRWWPADNFTDFSFIWAEEDARVLLQEFSEGPNENGKSWLHGLSGIFVTSESPNVLAAWFCGELVPKIEQCSDELLTEGIMFVLNKFVGRQYHNISKPDMVLRHGWYADPHFRGTYSFQTVQSHKGNVSSETVLQQPLTSSNGKETLLFAGEATHPYYYSTVHGAIETGHREARRIIDFTNRK